MEGHRNRQVHVLTGPLWMPTHYNPDNSPSAALEYRYPGIGNPPSIVAVPTHFFKVVVVVAKDKSTGKDQIEKFACFVMANRSTQSDGTTTITAAAAAAGTTTTTTTTNNSKNNSSSGSNDDQFLLQDFLVPWSTLETVTGLEFFSHLIDDDFRNRADELTLAQVYRRQRQNQAPQKPTFQQLLGASSSTSTSRGGGHKRNKGKELAMLEHLCKGGKCRI